MPGFGTANTHRISDESGVINTRQMFGSPDTAYVFDPALFLVYPSVLTPSSVVSQTSLRSSRSCGSRSASWRRAGAELEPPLRSKAPPKRARVGRACGSGLSVPSTSRVASLVVGSALPPPFPSPWEAVWVAGPAVHAQRKFHPSRASTHRGKQETRCGAWRAAWRRQPAPSGYRPSGDTSDRSYRARDRLVPVPRDLREQGHGHNSHLGSAARECHASRRGRGHLLRAETAAFRQPPGHLRCGALRKGLASCPFDASG